MFQAHPAIPIRELSLAIVGLSFPNPNQSSRRFEAALCAPGEPVFLKHEPGNAADPRAVAVFSMRGIQLGYLTAERCGWIGGRMEAGEAWEAIFQELCANIAVIRIRFGGDRPTLPRSMPAPAWARDDFHADPPGPIWGA